MRRPKNIPMHALPTVSLKEAATFWNMGYRKWKRLDESELVKYVRRFQNEREWRYVLVDILHAAFPEANNHTIHAIAVDYMQDRWRARIEASRAQRSGGEKNET